MSMDLLKCMLCNPDGQVAIYGTDEDRRIIQECLANIDAELAESKKLITKLDTDVADLHLIRSNLEDELALANDLGLLNEKLFNREIEDTKYESDQLMLVIEGQDANYERMLKEIAEAQRTIKWLRFHCPRPDAPLGMTPEKLQWNNDVQHYETHLTSNPPEEFT